MIRLSTHAKLFLSHFTAILLVSGSIGTYFYSSANESLMSSLKSRLQNSAALLSQSIDTTGLEAVRDAGDMSSPVYVERVTHLRNYVRANPDIAFIYIMRKDANQVRFVLDSDPAEPAEPGEVYPHHIPELLEGFLRPSVDREITSDQWGHFLSGYSPLSGGQGKYLVGLDMRADEVYKKFQQIRMAGIMSLIFSMMLAMVFSNLLSRHFTRRISALSNRCFVLGNIRLSSTPEQTPGDELARWGGEEFLVLLPQTHLKEARGLAERLRQQLEHMENAVTGSFGVVQYDASLSLTACIKKADKALYDAKKCGRNRVEVMLGKTPDAG